ncbi:flagellar basal body-associated FliL family protein [Corynebacterium gerontici]|uniref:hypothetical protein n=1 Tax=Corynebacterium gerontici TaxID=2079234 RepID=UPI000F511809|nr:hypothetical protein [Corynebacterium gerontici]
MSKNEWNDKPEYRDQDFAGGWGEQQTPETSMFPPQGEASASQPTNASSQQQMPQQQFPTNNQAQYASASTQAAPAQYAPAYQEPRKSNAPWIALVIVLVLALIAGGVVLYMRSQNATDSTAAEQDPVTVVTTVGPDGAEQESNKEQSTKQSTKQRPARPMLPSNAVAVSSGAKAGRQSGNLDNVWKSGPTSDSFALAVAKDFSDQYRTNGNTSPTLNVYSPVTGQTYQMSCSDNGQYVHCTGGNNANVYIA